MLLVRSRAHPNALLTAARYQYPSTHSFTSKISLAGHSPLPPRPPRTSSLAGTVPEHSSYLLLHIREPPSTWPPVFTSPLYLEARRMMKESNGLVNFCWLREEPSPPVIGGSGEAYIATLWEKLDSRELPRRTDIPVISGRNIEAVLRQSLERRPNSLPLAADNYEASFGPYFYVCTHGSRDCRCGIRGDELVKDLRQELQRRGMLSDKNGTPRVGQLGHVGGHQNAPNVLVFPYGDWYGNIESTDLPGLIDHYIRCLEEKPVSPSLLNGPNRLQWRGRMGMSKKEQSDAFQSHEWGATDSLGYSGLL